jgi:hypothetical protein
VTLDIPIRFAASRAAAVTVCVPLLSVVVSSVTEYGAALSSLPINFEPTQNDTPTTPTSSVALAVKLTDPDRIEFG